MEDKSVAIGGKHKGDVEGQGIVEPLLHPVADAVVVVLGLDDRNRNVGPVIEDIVGPFALAPADQLAAHDDPAFCEANLFTDLTELIPSSLPEGRCDELGAYVPFAEAFLVHRGQVFALPGRSNQRRRKCCSA